LKYVLIPREWEREDSIYAEKIKRTGTSENCPRKINRELLLLERGGLDFKCPKLCFVFVQLITPTEVNKLGMYG
jgi:hypothetical protein